MARPGLDNAIEGHTIESISFILDKDPIIAEKWSELATHLGIATHRIKKFREDVRLDKITHADLISGILELWKGQVGSAARFDKLNVAVKELGAVNVRESLEALQTTAEIANYSGLYVKALHSEIAGLKTEILHLKRELVPQGNIIERLNNENKQLGTDYENILQEKSVLMKNMDEEHVMIRGQIREQQRELDKMKISNGSQTREIARLKDELVKKDQETKRWDATVVRLETDNENFKHKYEEKDRELARFKTLYYKNENWDSELHLAVNRMDESAIHRLVENGADLEATNKELETPLHRAGDIKDKTTGLKILKYLIDKGANAYAKDNLNRNFLHILVADWKSLTPSQFHDIVTYIVSKNLSPLINTPGWSDGNSVFQVAVTKIEVTYETLLLLKQNGANFNYLDSRGDSILCFSLRGERSINLTSDLVQLGADWTNLNNNGHSLLHITAEFCHVDGVKYCINKGLDVNALDLYKDTPLHRVARYGKGDILCTVRVLIEHGAKLKIKAVDGKTPLDLWLAKGKDNKDLVQMLTFKK